MELTQEEALRIGKERGLVPQDYQLPKKELSQEEVIKIGIERGLVKPREDGAGFLVRTKFSFADTEKGKKQVLEDEYGKGNAYKYGDRWLVNEGGKKGFNFVDENKLSWKDAADLVGDVPEVAGATAGAVLGSGVMSIPAAGVGGAVGTGVKKLIAKGIGIENGQTPAEIAQDLGESTLWSSGGQAAGLGIVKGVNKALAPFADKMTPEAIARRELAKKYNVELTPAQVTQSPTLGQVENVLNNKIWSSDALAKFADEKQLTPFSESIKNISPQSSSDSIGKSIVDAINSNKNAQKTMFNQQYGDIANQIDKPIEVNTLIEQATNILEQNKNIPKTAQDSAVKIATEIIDNPSSLQYPEMSKLRTNLGELAKSGTVTGDIGTAQYKMLKGALDKDFNDFALNNGLGTKKTDVDTAYRSFKDAFENNTIKGIVGTGTKESMPVEKVVEAVVNPKEISRLDKVLQASNSDELVKDAVISKVIDKSKVADYSNPMYGSDMVSPTRFATQADMYGNHLSKVGADNVRELGKVAESIKFSDAFANHSNTAPTLLNSTMLGLLDPVNLGGKAYTSEIGRKYLTDGLGKVNPKYSGFGAAFAPLINQD